jgi:hypothetical protein
MGHRVFSNSNDLLLVRLDPRNALIERHLVDAIDVSSVDREPPSSNAIFDGLPVREREESLGIVGTLGIETRRYSIRPSPEV